ncbi:hypothetical protein U1Q18_011799, partial [Sarracenia purpurea var. burkii]
TNTPEKNNRTEPQASKKKSALTHYSAPWPESLLASKRIRGFRPALCGLSMIPARSCFSRHPLISENVSRATTERRERLKIESQRLIWRRRERQKTRQRRLKEERRRRFRSGGLAIEEERRMRVDRRQLRRRQREKERWMV